MTVQKFRHIGDVPEVPTVPLRAENLLAALELSETCLRFARRTSRRGVRRYRSVEELEAEGIERYRGAK